MDCRAVKRLIPALVDGELDLQKEEIVSGHLASCGSCRAEMLALKQTMAAMHACQDIEPVFTLADIKARAAERQTRRGWVHGFAWFSLAPRWTMVLGAAVAIFVGTVGGIGLHAVHKSTQPPAASRAVSDILSLGASDDPLADLIAERPSASSSTGSNGQEGRL